MKYIAATIAFVVTLWVTFMCVVFAFISFLGPHSPPASQLVETLLYVVSGAALLVFPVLAARSAWRRVGERRRWTSS